jgi:hypothetical protein
MKVPSVGPEGVPPAKGEEPPFKKGMENTCKIAKKWIIPVNTKDGKITPLGKRHVEKTSQLYEKIETATRHK